MKFQCAKCSHVFTASEADCDNWREPERAFICPSCATPLVNPLARDLHPRRLTNTLLEGVGVGWACSLIAGLIFGAVTLLAEASFPLALIVGCLVTLISGSLLFNYLSRPTLAPTIERSESP